jgi:pantoate kinase
MHESRGHDDGRGGTGAATAFVPGHVTAFFSAHARPDDPAAAGSRGAGVALSDGVRVTVADDGGGSAPGVVDFDGERVAVDPVGRVLDGLGVPGATVAATSDLPLGTGFGVSGALALGTAIAGNAAAGTTRSENDLVELAHVAEVEAGTGLGDVVAQARGGVPVRLEPGAPGAGGRLDGVPIRPRVEYVAFGELSTAEVLAGDTAALSAAGAAALSDLRAAPTGPRLLGLARRFAREADLLVPEVESALAAVAEAGGEAAMAMLGRSVFGFGTALSDAGYEASVCRTHAAGATLVDADAGSDSP